MLGIETDMMSVVNEVFKGKLGVDEQRDDMFGQNHRCPEQREC